MRSQALSTQPLILELDDQATTPGVSCAWPYASIACSLIPPNFRRLAIAVDPMPHPSCPCSVGAPKRCFPEPWTEAHSLLFATLVLPVTRLDKPASRSTWQCVEILTKTRSTSDKELEEFAR